MMKARLAVCGASLFFVNSNSVMKNYKIKTRHKMMLADTITPVSRYLRLRDKFANTILLESSDYHGHENRLSYICCKPIATIKAQNGNVEYHYPDSTKNGR